MPPDRGHEVLEHTADVGLRVWARDLAGLFEEAALGLIALMGTPTGEAGRREEIQLDAPDGVALLVDWLSEVLFLFDARRFVAQRVTAEVSEWRLHAVLWGGDADSFEQGGAAVKAVTYHDAELTRAGRGYEARVYLDV